MKKNEQISTTADYFENSAMPKARVIHANSDTPSTVEQQEIPAALSKKPVEKKSPAEWAYQRLVLYIKNFEEQLDSSHEIAMGFAGSETGVLRIEGIGHFDPDIITFYGTDQSGAKTQLIQHVSQLSVMLRALPKVQEAKEPNRIGFRLIEELEKEDA